MLGYSENRVLKKDGGGLLNSLIACWELDETSGSVAYDVAGGHNGNIYNVEIGQSGIINNCYNFNNGYVYVPDADDFNFNPLAENYSLGVWVKSDLPYHSYTARIIDTYTISGRPYPFNIYKRPNTGEVWLNLYNGGYSLHAIIPGHAVWDGDWHHLVMVVESAKIKGYLDGDLIDTVDIDYSEFVKLGTLKLAIGAESLGLGAFPFDGMIDQTAIWNRALTQSEISDLYNNGNGRAYVNF